MVEYDRIELNYWNESRLFKYCTTAEYKTKTLDNNI